MDLRKLLVAAGLVLSPIVAFAWWGNEWNFRKELTLDLTPAGGDIAATPQDVPLLVRLHLGNFGYFGDTKPDGSDVRFLAGDDKTPLKFHIERYDATNQLAFLWVRVPSLPGGTNTEKLYMYYGNQSAPSGAESAATYDANQVLVYHFGEQSGPPVDATAYANNPTSSSAELSTASLIAGGASFNGSQVISVPASASLRAVPSRGITFSAWVRVAEPQTDAQVFALESANARLLLGINALQPYARLAGAAAPIEAMGSTQLTAGQWHHLALRAGEGRLALLVDGVQVAETAAELPEIVGTLTIGGAAAGTNFLRGEVDEVQVSNVARSVDWIKAAARSQGQESALIGYGTDAQKEGGDVSYFKITMQNVTIDGWVVIVVLAVMFVIAMLIIISKAVFLGRVRQANASFIKEFERLKGDPTVLDRPESEQDAGDEALDESPFMPHLKGDAENKFRVSTLYRLYHHGVQEMTGRIGLTSAGARAVKTLTPQAIEAIRATMDASMVRLTQKLQAKMVILTICISGGPFLGLLGTVVGVMITFAAIAASGDVNVNSIAPGIAAALAATVAGLGVAIPALFGYNWLNTSIKEISADMRVFVDEFVTRIAEHYS
jgi:biopolymer transport protein ExbB